MEPAPDTLPAPIAKGNVAHGAVPREHAAQIRGSGTPTVAVARPQTWHVTSPPLNPSSTCNVASSATALRDRSRAAFRFAFSLQRAEQ
jgi:hypothetical protein